MFALLALLKGHFTVNFLVCEIIFEILCTKDRKSLFPIITVECKLRMKINIS